KTSRTLELSKARRTRTIRGGVWRIVLVAQTVYSSAWRRNVGVRVLLGRIVVETSGDRQTGSSRNQIWRAGALVVIPRLFAQLEVDDVLLNEDLVEKRLSGDDFRRQPVVRALFVELVERGHLVTRAIRGFRPDQRVFVVRDERLLEIRGRTCRAQPSRIATRREVLRFTRIAAANEKRVERVADGEVAATTGRTVELEVKVRLRCSRRERTDVVSGVARDSLLGLCERLSVSAGSHFGSVHVESGLKRVRHRRPKRWVTSINQIRR